jgi:hypothetical protein
MHRARFDGQVCLALLGRPAARYLAGSIVSYSSPIETALGSGKLKVDRSNRNGYRRIGVQLVT